MFCTSLFNRLYRKKNIKSPYQIKCPVSTPYRYQKTLGDVTPVAEDAGTVDHADDRSDSYDNALQISRVEENDSPSLLRKALIHRKILLDRIAAENLYDVVRKNPSAYFSKAPFINPNEGFDRAEILKKLQAKNFDLSTLNTTELKKAYKLDMIDIDDFLWHDQTDHGSSQSDLQISSFENIDEIGEVPWEILAMRNEFQAILRGDPSLDQAEAILKGKHITDPREFTCEDIQHIKKWDSEFHKRELLGCVLQCQHKIFEADAKVARSYNILQGTKQTVLEDNEYRQKIAQVQKESQSLWENAAAKKSARPWKAHAADKLPFCGDLSSRAPKYGDFNINSIKDESNKQVSSSTKKDHYTHYRVLRGRELRNSGKYLLTKRYS